MQLPNLTQQNYHLLIHVTQKTIHASLAVPKVSIPINVRLREEEDKARV